MKTGIWLPQYGPQATKQNIIELAKTAEQEHFDSLWVGERLLWPLRPQTPYPGAPDGRLPTFMQNGFDPLETLTFVATKTDKIALGTGVIDMLFHNPVILGRQFATLDVVLVLDGQKKLRLYTQSGQDNSCHGRQKCTDLWSRYCRRIIIAIEPIGAAGAPPPPPITGTSQSSPH